MSDDPTIRWNLASPFGIQVNEAQDAWYSGHVNAILELDTGQLLVGTATGGVWLVDPVSSNQPLSDDWLNPDINCLAFGPDGPRHVFAGCTGGVIRETDLAQGIPLLAWREITNPLPGEAGDVKRIVVIRNLRRIVAACQNGLYWATIPPTRGPGSAPTPRPLYEWVPAKVEGAAGGQGFYDVAFGATRDDQPRSQLEDRKTITIVAGGSSGGLFVGQWNDAGDLVLRQSKIHNDDGTDATGLFVLMGACSVTSCELRPRTLYAACSWKDGRLFRVLRSRDGGISWGILPGLVTLPTEDDLGNLAGDQGNDYDNCISVSPTNPGLVVLGWVSLFLTLDGGATWRMVDDTHLHSDFHALYFNPERSGSIGNVFIGSDGGVLRMNLDDYLNPPAGTPFQSNYNRQLPTLQCLETRADERFYGTLGASKTTPGIIATGAQDNGNLHCILVPSPTPWVDIDGGDGAWNGFIAEGAYLHNTLDGPVAATQFNSAGGVVTSTIVPISHPPSPAGSGLGEPVGEPVVRPTFRNAAGDRMHAVGAVGNQVFGLFVDENQSPRYYYDLIGSIPLGEVIAAVASYHGGSIFAGTQGGKMYALDSKNGSVLELPVLLPQPNPHAVVTGGYINRIVLFSEAQAFALMNGAKAVFTTVSPILGKKKTTIRSYYVLRLDGLKWVVTLGYGLKNERMLGLEAVALPNSEVPHALLVSTDDRVYISRDDGANWQQASLGLPRFPHCTDLRFVNYKTEAYLYLGTYGRSVWTAKLL